MAGKNNKKGRGAGGTVSSQPPKPSMLKVSMFQQASREARQKISDGVFKNQERLRRLERAPESKFAADDGGRKNLKGQASAKWALAIRRGQLQPGVFFKKGAGYRAPATRLY